jgi:hypothetical protein
MMKYKGFVIVPVMWWRVLGGMKTRDYTWRIALLILDQARRAPYPLVKITNLAAGKAGVSRSSKARAIQQLRKAGLILVQDRPRKSPIIKAMFVD